MRVELGPQTARGRVPYLFCAIAASRRDEDAIMRKLDGIDSRSCVAQVSDTHAARDLPDRCDAVGGPDRKAWTGRIEAQAANALLGDRDRTLPCRCVEQAHLIAAGEGAEQSVAGALIVKAVIR